MRLDEFYYWSREGGGAFPPPPTPEQFQNVQTNLGNLQDATGQPIITPFILSTDDAMRRDWVQRLLAAGTTQIPVNIKYFYHSHEFPHVWYNTHGKDWIDDLRGWVRQCADILRAGFQVLQIFWTQGDGNWDDPNSETRRFCDPHSPTYGPTLVRRVREACEAEGLPDLTRYAINLVGWEPDPRSIETCIPVLREALGPDREIALHLQVGYANPTGFGTEFWQSAVGQTIGYMFFQSPVCIPGEVDEFGQPSYQDSLIEVQNRFLPTGTPTPGTKGIYYRDFHDGQKVKQYTGVAQGPDWFGGAEKRASLVWFEGVAYYYTWRNPITPADNAWVQVCALNGQKLGYERFGNGVPL